MVWLSVPRKECSRDRSTGCGTHRGPALTTPGGAAPTSNCCLPAVAECGACGRRYGRHPSGIRRAYPHARWRATFPPTFSCPARAAASRHPGPHRLRQGLGPLGRITAPSWTTATPWSCRMCAGATRRKAFSIRCEQETGRRRRHAELDRAPALVGWQDRHDRRIVSGDRAVESGGLMNNPHLKAIFPAVSGCDDYRDRFYSPGGAMKLGHRLLWMSENLRAARIPSGFRKVHPAPALAHFRPGRHRATIRFFPAGSSIIPPTIRSGNRSACASKSDEIRVPVFSVGGWYDNFVESDLEAFARFARPRRDNPYPDRPVGAQLCRYQFPGVDFGPDAERPSARLQMQMVRSLAQEARTPGATASTDEPAGAHLRDGREPLARRA